MSKPGILGDIVEELETTAKQAVKVVAKTPSDFAKAASTQVIATGTDEAANNNQTNTAQDQKQTQDIVKSLYGMNQNTQQQNPQTSQPNNQEAKPEEKKKLDALRKTLHDEYYQKLIHPPKPEEVERPAEKVEKEKKMGELELQEKEKKKPPPLAVQMGAQKAEKFPGASG